MLHNLGLETILRKWKLNYGAMGTTFGGRKKNLNSELFVVFQCYHSCSDDRSENLAKAFFEDNITIIRAYKFMHHDKESFLEKPKPSKNISMILTNVFFLISNSFSMSEIREIKFKMAENNYDLIFYKTVVESPVSGY